VVRLQTAGLSKGELKAVRGAMAAEEYDGEELVHRCARCV
jgi:hypothetical protein